ncbi:Scr1 family TA system antitoxin-like transcriptional regulator [Kitasatospora sp. NPDC088351]|uniref:Scr1 family TA system antitoxin-like transcriptional regulator n=1 Tax=Kitasatospora sp. NPDC088351 TaxID=3155180 RepID=UPI00341BB213
MGRPHSLNETSGPLAEFASELRALREAAHLTVAETHQATGIPVSTIYAALSGTRTPSREVLAVLVTAWNGDRRAWAERRRELNLELRIESGLHGLIAAVSDTCEGCGSRFGTRRPADRKGSRCPGCHDPALRDHHPDGITLGDPASEQQAPVRHETLTALLLALREAAGQPPLRKLATDTGISASTLSRVLRGRGSPPWRVVDVMARALDASADDLKALRRLWEADLAESIGAPESNADETVDALQARIAELRHQLHAAEEELKRFQEKTTAPAGGPGTATTAPAGGPGTATGPTHHSTTVPTLPHGPAAEAGATNPTVAAMLLGARLRRLRLNLDLKAAADAAGMSVSKLSRLERGQSRPQLSDVHRLATFYRLPPEEAAELESLTAQANQPAWWHDYLDVTPGWLTRLMSLETVASELWTYEARVVPGLLQTEDYAKAVLAQNPGKAGRTRANRLVELRMERQKRFSTSPTESVFLLDESVLHRRVGNAEVMASQLQRLIDTFDTPGTSIRIISLDSAVAPSLASLTHLGFREAELAEMFYLEQPDSAEYIMESDPVPGPYRDLTARTTRPDFYREIHVRLLMQARTRQESLAALTEARDRFSQQPP